MQPMSSKGTAVNTMQGAANHRRIGNLFLESARKTNPETAKWGTDIMQVPEEEILTEYFFGMLATYLACVYEISDGNANAGKGFSSASAEIVFNGILDQTRERARKTSASEQKTVRARGTRARAAPRSSTLCPASLADASGFWTTTGILSLRQ